MALYILYYTVYTPVFIRKVHSLREAIVSHRRESQWLLQALLFWNFSWCTPKEKKKRLGIDMADSSYRHSGIGARRRTRTRSGPGAIMIIKKTTTKKNSANKHRAKEIEEKEGRKGRREKERKRHQLWLSVFPEGEAPHWRRWRGPCTSSFHAQIQHHRVHVTG